MRSIISVIVVASSLTLAIPAAAQSSQRVPTEQEAMAICEQMPAHQRKLEEDRQELQSLENRARSLGQLGRTYDIRLGLAQLRLSLEQYEHTLREMHRMCSRLGYRF